MKQTSTKLQEIKLVGITCRTNNALEMNPETANITPTAQKYFYQGGPGKIANRTSPGTTYCVYTNYESDFNGDYTYFIGEKVDSFEGISDEELETLTIHAQNYAKFTNGPDKMPEVCINSWQQIWNMNASDFGGERAYIADFELYDERSSDPQNVTLDIYIGIK